MDSENNSAVCGFCGSKDYSLLLKAKNYSYFLPLSFNVIKCSQCGQVRASPYLKHYFHPRAASKTQGETDKWYFLNPNRAKIAERFKTKGRIMDIGCGLGEFLADMKGRGWEVYGNDTSSDACAYAREAYGLENIYNEDLISLGFPDKFFDVVTLWHVVGHLEFIVKTFREIRRVLKDDGILVIESPNFDCLQRRLFREKWFGLALPNSINYFSPRRLKEILEPEGLEVIKRDYLVNLRVDFISFKKSLLRSLSLEQPPQAGQKNADAVLEGLKNNKIIRRMLRFGLEVVCFAVALFLSLAGCGMNFRIYCRKRL